MPENPDSTKLLTVITITKNDEIGLSRTIDSLADQKTNAWEYIVIDGKSTDNTSAVIQENDNIIDFSISESDSGIADAFNKGIEHASSPYLLFLNSGDLLEPNAIHKTLQALEDKSRSHAYLLIGLVKFGTTTNYRLTGKRPPQWAQLLRNRLPHQGMIIAQSAFHRFGSYDTSFSLGMDYEWSLRLYHFWDQIHFLNFPISIQAAGGRSISNFRKTFWYYHVARQKHKLLSPTTSWLIYIYYTTRVSIANSIKRTTSKIKAILNPFSRT